MVDQQVATLLSKCNCQLILVLLFILYAGPMMFDIFPSSDSYVGGIGFLGIWGVILAITIGVGLSLYYGFNCVSDKTVYRCAAFWCDEETKGLLFPKGFPKALKDKYVQEVGKHPSGFWSHFPLSGFNRTLRNLNNKYLYKTADGQVMADMGKLESETN